MEIEFQLVLLLFTTTAVTFTVNKKDKHQLSLTKRHCAFLLNIGNREVAPIRNCGMTCGIREEKRKHIRTPSNNWPFRKTTS